MDPLQTQNPPLNALIPPVPPPPSPSLGFQAWASDPQNAMKVAHNMTPPNQPLQPNASANPPVTNQYQQDMAQQNPKGLISPGNLPIWNRPSVQNPDGTHSSEYSISYGDDGGHEVLVPTVVDGKFLTPDGTKPPEGSPQEKSMFKRAIQYGQRTGQNLGVFDNPDDADAYAGVLHNRGTALTGSQAPMIQGASTNSLKPPAMASAMPPTPMPNVPASAAPPVGSPVDADRQKLKDLQTSGAGLNQIQNPFLRGLAKVGDVVGSIVSPGISALVPGTTMHNRLLQQHEGEIIAQDQNAIDQNAQQQQNAANLAHTNAETAAIPINAGLKQQQATAALAEHGLKVVQNDDGTTSVIPDETSPVFQKQQAQNAYFQARTESEQANSQLRQAETAAKNADPNTPAGQMAIKQYQLAVQRAQTAAQNGTTAAQRLGLSGQEFAFNQEKFFNPQPTAQERRMGDLGTSAVNQVKTMQQIVNGHPEVFGPAAGRKTTVQAWLGSQSPDVQRYLTAARYLADHSAGVFGSRSVEITKSLEQLTDPHINPDALKAALDQTQKTLNHFVQVGTVHGNPMQPPTSGGSSSGAAPEGTVVKMADGSTQVKRNGKWVAQ